MSNNIQRYAFTVAYPSRVNILKTNISITSSTVLEESKMKVDTIGAWDTGANHSVISSQLVQALNLKPIGITQVNGVHGESSCNNYLIDMILPNQVVIQQVRVIESNSIPFGVLVGMDIIGLGDFTISNSENKTKFSFQIPSTHNTDYVAEIEEINKKNRPSQKYTTDDIRAYLAKRKKK